MLSSGHLERCCAVYDELKRAARNSLIYSIGNISRKALGFVLLPLYVRRLTMADYGVLGILEITSQALIAVCGLGLYMALNRWFWDRSSQSKQKEIVFTIAAFLTFSSVIFYAVFHYLAPSLSRLIFASADYIYLLRLVVLVSLLEIIIQVFFTVMRLQEKAKLFTISNVSRLLITLLLTIYFIIGLKRGISGIFEAQLAGIMFYLLLISAYIIRNIRISFQSDILKEMLSYSLPLIISSISGIVLMMTDRYFLNFLVDLPQVAVYNLAAKFANLIQVFLVIPISMSLSPILYKMMDDPGSKKFYAKTFSYFSLLVVFSVLLVSLLSRDLIIIFTGSVPEYFTAFYIVPILSFAIMFGMFKDSFSLGLRITKRTIIISASMLLTAIFNIAANLILIPLFKAHGAAAATLLSHLMLSVAMYLLAQKYYRIPYEINKLILLILTGLSLYLLGMLSIHLNLILGVLFKIIILSLFPVALLMLGYFEQNEIARIRRFWQSNKLF